MDIHASQLPQFKKWLTDDGWKLCDSMKPNQAMRAWKEKFSGSGEKWCILNFSPDLDSEVLSAPHFSESLVRNFLSR